MAALEIRPKTRFFYEEDAIAVTRKVTTQARRNNPARLLVDAEESKLIVRFPREASEVWTPQMEVRMTPHAQGGVFIKAILGPRSSIWMLFSTTLVLIAGMGAIGLIVGFIQWSLRVPPWGFYLAVAGLCAGLFMWFLSEQGKRRAQDEMDLLKTFMDDALGTDRFLTSRNKPMRVVNDRVA